MLCSLAILNVIENGIVSEGYMYSRIDGSTSHSEGHILASKFNADNSQFILLTSLK